LRGIARTAHRIGCRASDAMDGDTTYPGDTETMTTLNWLYGLSDVGIAALFGGVAVFAFVVTPLIGRLLGWTATKDGADYIVRAQGTLINFTALILAFSLVQAMANFRKAEELVAKEAGDINFLDRQLLRYGDQGAALRPLLWSYTSSIIGDEWPTLRDGQRSPATKAAFNQFAPKVFALEPSAGRQVAIYTDILKSLESLVDFREQRIAAANVRLPLLFWGLTIVLMTILVGLSTMIQPILFYTISTAAQGLAIALLAVLVFCVDRPFQGETSVSSEPLVKALVLMKERM